MPAQDDAREKRLIDLFNLERPLNRARHGVDALLYVDGQELEFELKSITITRGGRSCPTAWCNCGGLVTALSGWAGMISLPGWAG